MLAGHLVDVYDDSAVARDVATLDTPGGAAALLTAYTSLCADLAPATRARHLSTLRSALVWWRQARWIRTDPPRPGPPRRSPRTAPGR